MLGGNVADADAGELALLTNDEVLAVNQDTATLQAKRVSNKDGLEIWTRPLAGGATALAFFNRTDDDATMRANLVELGLTGGYKARDLWQRKDFSIADGGVEMFVPAHGATMLRLRKSD
jgi:alpha-galactosidase